MSRDTVLTNIQSIQSFFPQDLVRKMWLTPVSEENIEELVARYTSTAFPPVFLPIFERDGNLYTIYLTPERELQQSPWVLLPHDAVEASIIASSFRYLPLSFLIPPHWFPERAEELWPSIIEFSSFVPSADVPSREQLDQLSNSRTQIRVAFDPGDVDAAVALALSTQNNDQEALLAIESISERFPNSVSCLLSISLLRSKLDHPDPLTPAKQVLFSEAVLGFRYQNDLIVAETGPEVLEAARKLVSTRPEELGSLAAMSSTSYLGLEAAEVLRTLSRELVNQSEPDRQQALFQLRNAATIVAHDEELDEAWCEELAQQAEAIEPGCLAASIAQFAAEVIHLGP